MALTFVTPPASPAGVKPYLRTAAHRPGSLMLGAGWGHTNTLHAHTGGAIINYSHRIKETATVASVFSFFGMGVTMGLINIMIIYSLCH